MPIQVQCPNCRRAAALPDSAAGKNVRCACGSIFAVQAPAAPPQVLDDLQLMPSDGGGFPEATARTAKLHRAAPKPFQGKRARGKNVTHGGSILDAGLSGVAFVAKAVVALLILGVLGGFGWVLYSRSNSGKPQPQSPVAASTPEKKNKCSPEFRKLVDDWMYRLSRTNSFLSKDQHRGLIYLILLRVADDPKVRPSDEFSDLLTLADLAPLQLKTIVTSPFNVGHCVAVGLQLEEKGVPRGAEKTYDALWAGWSEYGKVFKEKGTTIEAEARAYFGD